MIVAAFIWVIWGRSLKILRASILWSSTPSCLTTHRLSGDLAVAQNLGWAGCLAFPVLASAALFMSRLLPRNIQEHGVALTCILGLPCWLLGCILGGTSEDQARNRIAAFGRSIWTWRHTFWV